MINPYISSQFPYKKHKSIQIWVNGRYITETKAYVNLEKALKGYAFVTGASKNSIEVKYA